MNARELSRRDMSKRSFGDGPNPFADPPQPAESPAASEDPYAAAGSSERPPLEPGTYVSTLPDRSRFVLRLAVAGFSFEFVSFWISVVSFVTSGWNDGLWMAAPMALVGLALSLPACTFGGNDLRAMQVGAMNPAGQRRTRVAWYLGLVASLIGIGTVLAILAAWLREFFA